MTTLIQSFRKKPVTIQAVIWTGTGFSTSKVQEFMDQDVRVRVNSKDHKLDKLMIPTLEGEMEASIGDYIIRGVEGEFYPCKPGIFQKSYECVDPLPGRVAIACDHEYDRYLPGVTYNTTGTGPSEKLIPAGFSVCHKCGRIEMCFPGDKMPTIYEEGRLLEVVE